MTTLRVQQSKPNIQTSNSLAIERILRKDNKTLQQLNFLALSHNFLLQVPQICINNQVVSAFHMQHNR